MASRARRLSSASLIGCTLVLIAGWPAIGHATLGGDVTSVDADRVHAQGALIRISRVDAYSTHEIQTASGTNIREFVTPAGKVFGVAWDGPFPPDLQQLLGPYFEQFQAAASAAQLRRRGHGPLSIDEPGLVGRVAGRMRAFSGTVYVPQLVPQGVQADSIR